MTDKTETPAPAGVPWGLIFQIVQVILAILTYLAKRDPSETGKAELARISLNLETAAERATPEPDEGEIAQRLFKLARKPGEPK